MQTILLLHIKEQQTTNGLHQKYSMNGAVLIRDKTVFHCFCANMSNNDSIKPSVSVLVFGLASLIRRSSFSQMKQKQLNTFYHSHNYLKTLKAQLTVTREL